MEIIKRKRVRRVAGETVVMRIWDCPFGSGHKTKPCVLVEDLIIELEKQSKEATEQIKSQVWNEKDIELFKGKWSAIQSLKKQLQEQIKP